MTPIVLGIDTSGTWCSAAVVGSGAPAVRRLEVGNGHSDHLLAMVDAVLAEAEVRLEACAAVAFGAGPGSFTGLRIACAVAQGLAFGAGLMVAPIGTLATIAHSVIGEQPAAPRRLLVAQDARLGEIYWAVFTDGDLAGPEAGLASPARLRQVVTDGGEPIAIGCGNAWTVYPTELAGLVDRVVPRMAADAADVAMLGARAVVEGRLVSPGNAAPIYVRDRVALTTAERANRAEAVVG